jgi:Ca2+-binding RTX toxin-like protein
MDGAEALCTVDFTVHNFLVDLGDANDRVVLPATQNFVAYGREGDDELVGGSGWDVLEGGPGNDTLRGGRRGDLLIGGPGDDNVDGGPAGTYGDSIYAQGTNLRLTPTALYGEGTDRLSGIEWAELRGTAGRNVINARAWRGGTDISALGGADLIVGGFGPDAIVGGPGNDRIAGRGGWDYLHGGSGADVLFSRDRRRDGLNGGSGFDRARVDGVDLFERIEAFFS